MLLFKHPVELSAYLKNIQKSGMVTGFVPTMGALHEGHLSLLSLARDHSDFTIVSIFVNPTQFNDPGDFKKYPVTIEKDIEMLVDAGADALLLPSVADIYPDGTSAPFNVDLGDMGQRLEGEFRPGHFAGVYQVMDRLLSIVSPDLLFMGQKDYQQCMVIELLISRRHPHTRLNISPTLREEDGLAMSSRNLRLSTEERLVAPALHTALEFVKSNLENGEISGLTEYAIKQLESQGFRVDYLEVVNASTLEPVKRWNGIEPVVVITAAFLNEVRLIDNLVVNQQARTGSAS